MAFRLPSFMSGSIDKAKKPKVEPQGQTGRNTSDPLMRKLMTTQFDRSLFRNIRFNIPIMDRSIELLAALNGTLCCEAGKDRQQRLIDDFMLNVPVMNRNMEGGVESRGFNAALYQLSDLTLEQGFGIIEAVPDDSRRRSIVRIQVPDPLTFTFRDNGDGTTSLWQSQRVGMTKITPDEFLTAFAFTDRGGVYFPILWNTEALSEQVLEMLVSLRNLWRRFGDPSMLNVVTGTKDQEAKDINNVRKILADAIDEVLEARKKGKTADAYVSLLEGMKIESHILGESNSGGSSRPRSFQEDFRAVIEQLTVKTGLPGWMLQQNWSTTERNASESLKMVLNDAARRQAALIGLGRKYLRKHLDMNGRAGWIENQDYRFYWDNVDIDDSLNQAQTKLTDEQAEAARLANIAIREEYGWITPEQAIAESNARPVS